MKKLRLGQLYMEQEKTEEAYEKLENIILSEYTTLNLAFGMMITKALDNKDHKSARFLAEKMYALAGIFEMGKYNECATMFNVVVAEQNVEDTFKVIKQLLENVDTICDFQKSRLYKHIKFQDASDDSYITLIYNTDYRSYHYKVVVQGETIIEGWDAFVGFGMILSSEMQMNLNEYLDGTEDTISVFIPRYALTISVLPEQEIR